MRSSGGEATPRKFVLLNLARTGMRANREEEGGGVPRQVYGASSTLHDPPLDTVDNYSSISLGLSNGIRN